MSKWVLQKAAEFCASVRDGTHDSPKSVEGGGKPLVTSKVVKQGVVRVEDAYLISEKDYRKINERSKVDRWDILMTMIGTVGECAIVKDDPDYAIKNIALFKMAGDEEKSKWLYYYLTSPTGQGALRGNFRGSSQQYISLDQLRNLEVPVPEKDVRSRIVAILSDYDSAIDNARRQIALLEEAAMRLYREWFRDGKGEKKRIWEILRHYANGGWGKENSIGKFTECGYVIRGTDIDDLSYGNRSSIPLRVHSKHDIETKRLISGDIIIELSNGNIDNIGRSLLVSDDMLSWFDDVVICASFCKFMRPIDNQMSIALAWHIKYLQSSGKMKVFKNAGANGINNFAFDEFLDSEIQLGDFDSKLFTVLGNMTLQIQTMRSQIRTLTEARDRLLPKLMSGEVSV